MIDKNDVLEALNEVEDPEMKISVIAVSYTHLTLPTILRV